MSNSTARAVATAPHPPSKASALMPALMSACVMVVVAMVAAINLAIPKLSAGDLHPTSTQLLWIVDAYILVFGCLLIPAGALGDRVGRKGVLLSGLGIFAAGCAVSLSAWTMPVLLTGRVITGAGAALVMPATLSLLLQVTPADRKPHAIATWTAATGSAGALGNLVGGLVLQWLPWQALFAVFGPLAVLLAVGVMRIAPRGERHAAGLDIVGTATLTAGVFALLFGIIEGPEHGWTSAVVIGSFVVGASILAAFVVRSLHVAQPLLDPRVFRLAGLRAGTIGVGAVFFGLFALFFENAQYLQFVKGYSPLETGVAILPLPVALFAVSRRSIRWARRFGEQQIVRAGLLVIGIGLVGLSFADAHTPYPLYALALTVVAVGAGLSVPSLSTGIVTSLPQSHAGMGSGLNSASREIGAALGVAVVGSVLAGRFRHALPDALRAETGSVHEALRAAREFGPSVHRDAVEAFTGAMSTGFRVVAAIMAVATLAVSHGRSSAHRAR